MYRKTKLIEVLACWAQEEEEEEEEEEEGH